MKNKTSIGVKKLLLVCCVGSMGTSATADVYYYDDFEAQPLTTPPTALSLPPVGLPYHYTTGTAIAAVNVVGSPLPTFGTKSLEALRNESIQPNVASVSLDNAIVSGKTIQWEWSHQLFGGTGHAFNAPMQVSLGYTNGGIGRLAWITILDRIPNQPARYYYSDAFISSEIRTELAPTIGGWDRFRLVMTPMESVDFPGYVTGKYDLYISLNGAPEILVKTGADNEFATPPQLGDEYYGDLKSAFIRIQKGPSTSNSYYDNISLRDYASWNVNSSGTWTTGTNWSPNTAPNNGTVANFGPAITSARTVTVDAPHTISTMRFENANRYTIAGSGMLTLAFACDGAQIDIAAGSHTITAPLTLATNTKVDVVNAADTLTISGTMTGTGVKLTKAGAGKLEVANLRAGAVDIKAGVLKVLSTATPGNAAGASLLNSLAIAGGTTPTASLDLTNNGIAIDYTGPTPFGTLRAQIIAGLSSSNGITSSSIIAGRSIGIAEASDLSLTSFLGQTVDGSSVLIRYTLVGDADLNGNVNFDDLLRLAQAYGSANGTWSSGDSTYNGTVDFDDLLGMAQNYGAALLANNELGFDPTADFEADWALARSMVPEPVTALSLIALSAGGRRRRN